MRVARLVPPLTLAALALPLLAGCGGASSSGSPSAQTTGPSSSAPASASTPPASASGAAVSCSAAPATLVGSALADTLSAAQETRNGDTIVVCDYKGPKTGLVKLRIQTDSSADAFAVDKKGFTTQSMKTVDEAFADEAFSTVVGSGQYQVTTLVARHGTVEILIAAKATVAQEKGLLNQLFNRL
jgi:hypothetical protein